MFQGYSNAIKIETKNSTGINIQDKKQSPNISMLQNIEKTPQGSFKTRSNCINVFNIPDITTGDIRVFDDVLKVMNYVDSAGEQQLLIYQTYFSKLEAYFDKYPNAEIEAINNALAYENGLIQVSQVTNIRGAEENRTNFRIDFSGLNDDSIELIRRYFYNDVKIGIINPSKSYFKYINEFEIDEHKICTFWSNVRYSLLDIDPSLQVFRLYPHRACVIKFEKKDRFDPVQNYQVLRENLDPNVFVSSLNYLSKLLIVNSIDRNMEYDGDTIEDMETYGDMHAITDDIKINSATEIEFKCLKKLQSFVEGGLFTDNKLLLVYLFSDQSDNEVANVAIEDETVEAGEEEIIKVTVTLKENIETDKIIRELLYKSTMPKFSFITTSRDRLWALAGGRHRKDDLRSTDKNMYVYYSFIRLNTKRWTNPLTNQIDYINCASKSDVVDSLECIYPYRHYLMFIGRNRTQVWLGETPLSDGITGVDQEQVPLENIFRWESTINTGVFNQNCLVPMKNDLLFINSDGLNIVNTNNPSKNIFIDPTFNERLGEMFGRDYQNVKKESDYRKMHAFNYEYKNTIGFKLSKGVYMLNQMGDGFLSIYGQAFVDANNISYDFLTKTLFLASKNGRVNVFNDKTTNNSSKYWLIKNAEDALTRFDEDEIHWKISYEYFGVNSTWYNDAIYFDMRTERPCEFDFRLYIDNYHIPIWKDDVTVDLTPTPDLKVENNHVGSRYGKMLMTGLFANAKVPFSYIVKRYSCDVMKFQMKGINREMELKAVYFAGSNQNEQI